MGGYRRIALALVFVAALVGVGATVRTVAFRPSAPWWKSPAAIRRGAYDFATGACISCHTIAGVSSASAGAELTHEGRKRTAAWILHDLLHPTCDRPPVPHGQERDLAAYLASLR